MTDTEIILIRHGQANSDAKTEEDYDRLSDLGHQQASWLGQYLKSLQVPFDHLISGDLNRHRETASSMDLGLKAQIDPRVNEMRYFDMAHELERQTGQSIPTNTSEFGTHLPKVLAAWEAGKMDHVHMPLATFKQGFLDVVQGCFDRGGRTAIVTSGGVIGTFVAASLGLAHKEAGALILPIFNSSMHRVVQVHGMGRVSGFNGTPHLDHGDRMHAKTHV